ncbi:ROK family transcriptional regulator [Isoptericola hypogeus]|uniref:ROK family transcriptional regulator n=1 Tax=Isoptericola hypogeus TaxID=300179 RepID=A0ABN2J9D1_9MICO
MSEARATAPLTQSDVKRHNASLVMRGIRDHPGTTRTGLAATLGVTKVGIARHIDALTAAGLVQEDVARAHGRGRPGLRLRLTKEQFYVLGYDLRIDRHTEIVCDLAGGERRRATLPRAPRARLERLVQSVAQRVHQALDSEPGRLCGIAVSLPARFSDDWDAVTQSVFEGPPDYPILAELRAAIGTDVPVTMTDIPSAASLAHSRVSGRGNLMHIQIGTSAGLAVTDDARAWHHQRQRSLALGDMPIELDGLPCPCGSRGCADTRIGFRALADRVTARGLPLPPAGADDIQAAAALIADACAREVPGIAGAVATCARWTALATAQVVLLRSPGALTLGGYPQALGDHFLQPFVRELDQLVPGSGDLLVQSGLGDDASTLGAALVAAEPLFDDPLSIAGRAVAGADPLSGQEVRNVVP